VTHRQYTTYKCLVTNENKCFTGRNTVCPGFIFKINTRSQPANMQWNTLFRAGKNIFPGLRHFLRGIFPGCDLVVYWEWAAHPGVTGSLDGASAISYSRGQQTENRFTDQTYFQHDAIGRTRYACSSYNEEDIDRHYLNFCTMFINVAIADVSVVSFHGLSKLS
jgi:hypothetical protein